MTDSTAFLPELARANIRELLERSDLTSFSLSERIGKNRTFIDDFLRSKKKSLPYSAVLQIAKNLQVPPSVVAGVSTISEMTAIDIFLPGSSPDDAKIAREWLKSSPVKWNGSRIIACGPDDPLYFKLTIEAGPRSFVEAMKLYHIPSHAQIQAISNCTVMAEEIPELDVTIEQIGYPTPVEVTQKYRLYQPGVVIDKWELPWRYLSNEMRLDPRNLDIIAINDDAMADSGGYGLSEGDRVVIDRSDRSIKRAGIFAIAEDDQVLVRQIELLRDRTVPTIKCISLNRRYEPFELQLGDTSSILGRMALKIGRS